MAGVVALVDDLFFGAKLRETAKRLDVPLLLAHPSRDAAAIIRQRRPTLVIVDLQAEAFRPLETVRGIKADPGLHTTPVLGYFAHVRDDLREAGVAAGCDELLPRSAFSAHLAEILQRCSLAPAERISNTPADPRP